jgi:hypothetical protein
MNVLLLAVAAVCIWAQLAAPGEGAFMQLETGSFGTLLVAWGVLLEAREIAVERCRTYKCPHEGLDRALNIECGRFGLGIVCLGLLIEGMNELGDASSRGLLPAGLGPWMARGAWLPFLLGVADLVANCVVVVRLRFIPPLRERVRASALEHAAA